MDRWVSMSTGRNHYRKMQYWAGDLYIRENIWDVASMFRYDIIYLSQDNHMYKRQDMPCRDINRGVPFALARPFGMHDSVAVSMHFNGGDLVAAYYTFSETLNSLKLRHISWSCNYTPSSSWSGYTGFTLSVCPSVRVSVCGQNLVRSVSSTILAGSISYLHILSTNFRKRIACQVLWKIPKF